jgi:hypothetical protein
VATFGRSGGWFRRRGGLHLGVDLKGVPIRVASGNSDPFRPGVEALAAALPKSAVVDFSQGCHLGPFFTDQETPSLAFLAEHLTR